MAQNCQQNMTAASEPEECAICWDAKANNEMIKTLCGHVLCSLCFSNHFSKNDLCPVCRTDVYPKGIMGKAHSTPARAGSVSTPAVAPTPATTDLTPDDFDRIYTSKFFYESPPHNEQLRHLISRHPNGRGTRDLEYGYDLNDMAYIKYKRLIAASMAAIHWVIPNHDLSNELYRPLCRHWWHDTANRIERFLRKANHEKMKGDKLLERLEKATRSGNHRIRPEGIHYAPWVIQRMPESQRADFETHLEWVLHRIVEVAQQAHRDKFGL